jgi:hypothetical protein
MAAPSASCLKTAIGRYRDSRPSTCQSQKLI